jgi:hypothetical protein
VEGINRVIDVTWALRKGAPTWLLQFPALVKADQRDALQRETIGATRERMVREICEVFEAIGTDRVLIVVLESVERGAWKSAPAASASELAIPATAQGHVPQGPPAEHPAFEQGPGGDSEASARRGLAVSDV